MADEYNVDTAEKLANEAMVKCFFCLCREGLFICLSLSNLFLACCNLANFVWIFFCFSVCRSQRRCQYTNNSLPHSPLQWGPVTWHACLSLSQLFKIILWLWFFHFHRSFDGHIHWNYVNRLALLVVVMYFWYISKSRSMMWEYMLVRWTILVGLMYQHPLLQTRIPTSTSICCIWWCIIFWYFCLPGFLS